MIGKFAFPLTVLIAATAAVSAAATGMQDAALPPGHGLDVINAKCGFCHTTSQVFVARKSPEDWAGTVQSMIDRGAELTAEEQKAVIDYLGTNFSTGAAAATPAKPATPAASPTPAPAKL